MNRIPALVHFLHQDCASPANDTWYNSIDAGFFTTWKGLTSSLMRNHLPKFIDTAEGHLRLSH